MRDNVLGARGGHESPQQPDDHLCADHLRAVLERLAGAAPADRVALLQAGPAALDGLERQLPEARASLRTAEEVVVRQEALLETATELIETDRRRSRSLWTTARRHRSR